MLALADEYRMPLRQFVRWYRHMDEIHEVYALREFQEEEREKRRQEAER